MRKFHLLILLLLPSFCFAQVANDICETATPFGTLTPFVQSCQIGNNLTALGELPYVNQGYCFGGVDAPAPAADVWFTFTAVGNLLDIVLDSNWDTAMVALYQGSCGGLIGLKCVVNESGGYINTSLAPVSVGNTYYIQISGGSISDIGNYSLCINSYQSFEIICIIDQNITVDPVPYLGTYEAGQTVNICLTVGGYQQNSADWFDGLVPVFGSGWDISTLVPVSPASCDGAGAWGWYDSVQGTSTYAINNVGAVGPGFFYDRIIDGNPGNDFGDNSSGDACDWVFCMTITTKAACPPGFDGEDLSIEFFNYSDSEAGSWNASSSPCPNDPNFTFKALLSCCTIPDVVGVSPTCNDPLSGNITITGGGVPPFEYTWSTGFTQTTAGASTVTGLPIGFYYITVTDANDCEKIVTYLLANADIPALSLAYSVPSTCNPGNGLAVLLASGTLEPYTFSLTDAAGNTTTQTDPNFNNLAPGAYTASVVDGGGCQNEITIEVAGLPPLDVQIADLLPGLCAGDANGSASLTAGGGFAPYQFSIDGGANQPTGNFTGLTAGNHNVTVTDVSGCTVLLSVVIPDVEPVTASSQIAAQVRCFGGNEGAYIMQAQGGTPPYLYAPDGVNFAAADTASGLTAGNYTFSVQDANGCTAQGAATITQPDVVDIELPQDTEIPEGDFVTLQPNIISGIANTYAWLPTAGLDCANCPQVNASPTETTTYQVTVANANDCADTDSITITVLKEGVALIPNAFSPNADGINDVFRISGRFITSANLVVYNRWGQQVFTSSDFTAGWNGKIKGEDAPAGVYVYYAEVAFDNGDTKILKGNVTLIR